MPVKNNYLENALPNLYRREAMHISIFTFIDTYKLIVESVTLNEAAKAYMIHYKINDDLYSQESIVAIYYRVQKDLQDLHKLQNKEKAFPIKS